MRIFRMARLRHALHGTLLSLMLAGSQMPAQAGNLMALTFDDGPHPKITPRILEILRQENVPATFFVVGWRAERWPRLLRRIHAEGHEIGNHTWSHPNLLRLSNAAIKRQLARTDRAVLKATGTFPSVVRPPYGAMNLRVFQQDSRAFLCWQIDTLDWKHRNARNIIRRALHKKRGIILFHDIVSANVHALRTIIRRLKASGVRFVHASQLQAHCIRSKRYLQLAAMRRQHSLRLAAMQWRKAPSVKLAMHEDQKKPFSNPAAPALRRNTFGPTLRLISFDVKSQPRDHMAVASRRQDAPAIPSLRLTILLDHGHHNRP